MSLGQPVTGDLVHHPKEHRFYPTQGGKWRGLYDEICALCRSLWCLSSRWQLGGCCSGAEKGLRRTAIPETKGGKEFRKDIGGKMSRIWWLPGSVACKGGRRLRWLSHLWRQLTTDANTEEGIGVRRRDTASASPIVNFKRCLGEDALWTCPGDNWLSECRTKGKG